MKIKEKQKFILMFLILAIIAFCGTFLRDSYRQKKLLKSKITYAIVTNFAVGGKGPGQLKVKFKINNRIKNATFYGSLVECGNYIEINDTVLIKYSISDNSVVQLLKCYWNDELRDKYFKTK